MKHCSHVLIAALSLYGAVVSAEEAELTSILNKEEVTQHQQLALSLRNQKLLEQQAESRAKQLLFQLQAAEAWAAIQRLGVQVNSVNNNEVEGNVAPEMYNAEGQALMGYRVFAIIKRGEHWIARIGNEQKVFTVRDGSELKPGIDVHIENNLVRLVGKGWQHELMME